MKTGFARVDITPFLNVGLSGYFNYRFADGILDPLYVNALAVRDGENTALLMSVDVIGIPLSLLDDWIPRIARDNNIPAENVFIACTHTHTGPSLVGGDKDEQYNEFLPRRLSDAGRMAISDLAESSFSVGFGVADDISFIRRYKMKDGSVRTNPGLFNPDVVEPMGKPDNQVQTIYIKREGKKDIMLVQFQVHPDVIGGKKFSADYPGVVRETVEKLHPEAHCIYFNGCQGDTNHINIYPQNKKGWKSYAHSQSMGRIIAAAALGSLDKLVECENAPLTVEKRYTPVELKNTSEEDVAWAKELLSHCEEGNVYSSSMSELGKVALAKKILMYAGMKEFPMPVSAIAFGGVVFVSMPGEPFTEIGRQIKAHSKYDATFVCCCANGYQGYLPTKDAFEGEYESTSSIFAPGVAERLIETGIDLVK